MFILWQSDVDNCSESIVTTFKNLNWTIWFPLIDPVTHVTRIENYGIALRFTDGPDPVSALVKIVVCTTQAIGSSTLLIYHARVTSHALQPPAHHHELQQSHVNIHQHSYENLHDMYEQMTMIFACNSTESYYIKCSSAHQQVVQAIAMLVIVWTCS